MSGVPKTTLRFEDLLGGLTELRKAVMFTVKVYYSERIQIKISKGERYTGQGPGTGFQLYPLSGIIEILLNSPNTTKEAYLKL